MRMSERGGLLFGVFLVLVFFVAGAWGQTSQAALDTGGNNDASCMKAQYCVSKKNLPSKYLTGTCGPAVKKADMKKNGLIGLPCTEVQGKVTTKGTCKAWGKCEGTKSTDGKKAEELPPDGDQQTKKAAEDVKKALDQQSAQPVKMPAAEQQPKTTPSTEPQPEPSDTGENNTPGESTSDATSPGKQLEQLAGNDQKTPTDSANSDASVPLTESLSDPESLSLNDKSPSQSDAQKELEKIADANTYRKPDSTFGNPKADTPPADKPRDSFFDDPAAVAENISERAKEVLKEVLEDVRDGVDQSLGKLEDALKQARERRNPPIASPPEGSEPLEMSREEIQSRIDRLDPKIDADAEEIQELKNLQEGRKTAPPWPNYKDVAKLGGPDGGDTDDPTLYGEDTPGNKSKEEGRITLEPERNAPYELLPRLEPEETPQDGEDGEAMSFEEMMAEVRAKQEADLNKRIEKSLADAVKTPQDIARLDESIAKAEQYVKDYDDARARIEQAIEDANKVAAAGPLGETPVEPEPQPNTPAEVATMRDAESDVPNLVEDTWEGYAEWAQMQAERATDAARELASTMFDEAEQAWDNLWNDGTSDVADGTEWDNAISDLNSDVTDGNEWDTAISDQNSDVADGKEWEKALDEQAIPPDLTQDEYDAYNELEKRRAELTQPVRTVTLPSTRYNPFNPSENAGNGGKGKSTVGKYTNKPVEGDPRYEQIATIDPRLKKGSIVIPCNGDRCLDRAVVVGDGGGKSVDLTNKIAREIGCYNCDVTLKILQEGFAVNTKAPQLTYDKFTPVFAKVAEINAAMAYRPPPVTAEQFYSPISDAIDWSAYPGYAIDTTPSPPSYVSPNDSWITADYTPSYPIAYPPEAPYIEAPSYTYDAPSMYDVDARDWSAVSPPPADTISRDWNYGDNDSWEPPVYGYEPPEWAPVGPSEPPPAFANLDIDFSADEYAADIPRAESVESPPDAVEGPDNDGYPDGDQSFDQPVDPRDPSDDQDDSKAVARDPAPEDSKVEPEGDAPVDAPKDAQEIQRTQLCGERPCDDQEPSPDDGKVTLDTLAKDKADADKAREDASAEFDRRAAELEKMDADAKAARESEKSWRDLAKELNDKAAFEPKDGADEYRRRADESDKEANDAALRAARLEEKVKTDRDTLMQDLASATERDREAAKERAATADALSKQAANQASKQASDIWDVLDRDVKEGWDAAVTAAREGAAELAKAGERLAETFTGPTQSEKEQPAPAEVRIPEQNARPGRTPEEQRQVVAIQRARTLSDLAQAVGQRLPSVAERRLYWNELRAANPNNPVFKQTYFGRASQNRVFLRNMQTYFLSYYR